MGLAGAGYNQGISVYAYEWMTTVILVIFIFFLLPFYLRSRVYTLPEFLERRFDGRARIAFSGFNLFAKMFGFSRQPMFEIPQESRAAVEKAPEIKF